MNEQQFANKVRQILDHGTRLDSATAERLRAARERALAARKTEPESALAWADNVLGRVGGVGGLSLRLLLPAALVALSVAAIYSWQQNQRLAEIEENETMIHGVASSASYSRRVPRSGSSRRPRDPARLL